MILCLNASNCPIKRGKGFNVKYLLDTNMCIYIINKNPKNVLAHFERYTVGDLCVSTVTTSELYFGVFNSSKVDQNMAALNEFLLSFSILPFSNEAAVIYGKLRAELSKTGMLIGNMDLMIAAHALSLKLPIVTNNTREFIRIPHLVVEDWTR